MSWRFEFASLFSDVLAGLKHLALIGLVVPFLAPPALAQSTTAPTVATVAMYKGPDRMQRLIDGAKKEGTLTIYTSMTVKDMDALTTAFEKKYGIKARVWRSSSENILQRAVVENRAGRFEADLFESDGSAMEALRREKLMQEVKSPALADLLPEAIPPHRAWIGTRLNIITAAYNTNLVKKDELPKTYEDLLDSKWKGKLGIEADDADWFATVVAAMGEENGLRLFKNIVAKDGISVRKGHTLLANLVASGEVPLALTVYLYKVDQLKNNGAPIDKFVLPPVVARINGIGLARKAPHPHAAMLFFDFMLTDGQTILAHREFWPTNRKVKQLPDQFGLKFVDSAKQLDEGDKWDKLYKEIVANQSR